MTLGAPPPNYQRMDLRHAAANIAATVLLCIMAMFLHPVAHGPYSAVHGPTTALRSLYKLWLLALAAVAVVLSAALRAPGAFAGSNRHSGAACAISGPTLKPLPLRC